MVTRFRRWPEHGSASRWRASSGSDSKGESQTPPEDSAARQVAIDLAGDVALQNPDDLGLGLALLDSSLEVGWVLGSCAMRTITMRHSAVFAWRSPRVGLDLAAGLARPRRDRCDAAQTGPGASECSRSGLSPAATTSAAAVSGPTPKRSNRSGTLATRRASIRSSSAASSRSSASMRCASDDSDDLVAAVTGSGERVGRAGPFSDEGRHRQPFEANAAALGGVAEVAHLDEGLDAGLAGRALGHDEHSDRLGGTVLTWRARSPDH